MAKFPSYGSVSDFYTQASRPDDFPHTEFKYVCESLSTSMFSIHSHASSLEVVLKMIGTQKDGPALRDKIHTTQQTANQTIVRSMESLKHLQNLSQKGSRHNKLQVERIRNEFQQAVTRYSTIQMKLTGKIKSSFPPKAATPQQPQKLTVAANWQDEQAYGDTVGLMEEGENRKLQQLEVQRELEFDRDMLLERESRIRQIESDVIDINQIFKELGAMIHDQGEALDRIEDNIEVTAHDVETGRDQLLKAKNYQKKYRTKLCCVLVILTLIGIVITVIIVLTSK